MPTETLESILLSNDTRRISLLSGYLSERYCLEAARLLLAHPARVLLCTGFFISRAMLPETDGPPGTLAIGEALIRLGYQPAYVSDQFSAPLLKKFANGAPVFTFPLLSEAESVCFAGELIERFRPTLLVSVERCGVTHRGRYLDWKEVDISDHNARMDTLFQFRIPSIGIGDGGNEIGMGNLAEQIAAAPGLPKEPCVTRADALVIASVSNWGAYGLVAGLSRLTGISLLPTSQAESRRIREMIEFGACDGARAECVPGVDGFTLEENAQIIDRLQAWVDDPLADLAD
jgi:hypothetical protein